MEQTLRFLEGNQVWIYLLLLIVGLIYLRTTLKWSRDVRRALFSLERERALGRLTRSAAMLALTVAVGLALFVLATFVGPTILARIPATTVSPTSLAPGPIESGSGTPAASAMTVEAAEGTASAGCANPNATLTYPQDGEILSGVVTIKGSVDIANLGFYKFEYRQLVADAVWRPIAAGLEAMHDGELGTWDTTLVSSGDYEFRLVVTDTTGLAEEPCTVSVRVINP